MKQAASQINELCFPEQGQQEMEGFVSRTYFGGDFYSWKRVGHVTPKFIQINVYHGEKKESQREKVGVGGRRETLLSVLMQSIFNMPEKVSSH